MKKSLYNFQPSHFYPSCATLNKYHPKPKTVFELIYLIFASIDLYWSETIPVYPTLSSIVSFSMFMLNCCKGTKLCWMECLWLLV